MPYTSLSRSFSLLPSLSLTHTHTHTHTQVARWTTMPQLPLQNHYQHMNESRHTNLFLAFSLSLSLTHTHTHIHRSPDGGRCPNCRSKITINPDTAPADTALLARVKAVVPDADRLTRQALHEKELHQLRQVKVIDLNMYINAYLCIYIYICIYVCVYI